MADQVTSEFNQYLTFTLDQERFALNIGCIREILEDKDLTKIPGMPECMRGVLNVRGHPVPVLDLRLKFGMPQTEMTVDTCVIITESGQGEEVEYLGALADSVQEVLELAQDEIDPPPKMGATIDSQYILGMGKREDGFIIILDPRKVFSNSPSEEGFPAIENPVSPTIDLDA